MSLFKNLVLPQPPRAVLRAKLVGEGGVPAHLADEVLDLSLHAEACALRALFDVSDRAGNTAIAFAVAGLASSLLRAQLEVFEKAMRAVVEENGGKTTLHTIKVNDDG